MTDEQGEMQLVETEGKTVDEAVEKALEMLHITRDLADVDVLEAGSKGFFSVIGARNARVRVSVRKGVWEERVRQVVDGLMERMGINSQVHAETIDGVVHVRIDSAGSDGLLIGRRGETLSAIQHLVTRMVNRDNTRKVQIAVDVGGYKRRREAQLENLARALAARVEASGQQLLTEPLNAAERRIVHITLRDNSSVRTETLGEGLVKKVAVIRVKDNASVPGSSPN